MLEGAVFDWLIRAISDNQSKILGTATLQLMKIKEFVSENFCEYFENTLARCAYVPVLFDKGKTLPLTEVYVNSYLELSKGSRIRDEKLRDFIVNIYAQDRIRIFLIVGPAGTGKTFLLRWLFVSMVENESSRIPLYVELRGMNNAVDLDLVSFIHNSITGGRAIISDQSFRNGLSNGGFILLLDGLDEVRLDRRSKLNREMVRLQDDYPGLIIVVSSRHDEALDAWTVARRYSILPFDKSDTLKLIQKVPYRNEIKDKFTKDVERTLYDQHKSFLSNPLLTTIMLLTYSDLGSVPSKMHLFYEQAFLTLFYRHDTWKETGYQREHYAKLPVNKFRDCVSSFCMYSYASSTFEFSKISALDKIEVAAKFEKIDIDPSDFLLDMTESVCILHLEGIQYKFIHRGFQEYFTSAFICRSPQVDLARILDKISHRRGDNVISMAADMNRSLLENVWILPRLKSMQLNGSTNDALIRFSLAMLGTLQFEGKGVIKYLKQKRLQNTTVFCVVAAIRDIYPDLDIQPLDRLLHTSVNIEKIEDVWNKICDQWLVKCDQTGGLFYTDRVAFNKIMKDFSFELGWSEATQIILRVYTEVGGIFRDSSCDYRAAELFRQRLEAEFISWANINRDLGPEDWAWFSVTECADNMSAIQHIIADFLEKTSSSDNSEDFLKILYEPK